MADDSTFWLPTLAKIAHSLSEMAEPTKTNDEGDVEGYGGKNWFTPYNITMADAEQFMTDISPAIAAMLLAGYKVTAVEVGLTPHISLGGVEATYENDGQLQYTDLSDKWLRLNLQERKVEINARSSSDTRTTNNNFVRLFVEPFTFQGEVIGIGITQEDIDGLPFSYLEYDRPLDELLAERYEDKVEYNGSAGTVSDYRQNIMEQFIDGLAGGGTIVIESGLEESEKSLLFKSLSEMVFDSIFCLLLDVLANRWKETFRVDGSEEEFDFSLPKTLPGMLGLFDTSKWGIEQSIDVSDEDTGGYSVDLSLQQGQVVGVGATALSLLHLGGADSVAGGGGDTEEAWEKWFERYKPTPNIEEIFYLFEDEADENRYNADQRTVFLLQQCLGCRVPGGLGRKKKARDTLKETLQDLEVFGERYGYETSAGTYRFNGHDTHVFYDNLRVLLEELNEGLTPAEARRYARIMRRRPYLETILHLVNLGVLAVSCFDAEGSGYEYDDGEAVQAYYNNDISEQPKLELTLSGYTHEPLKLFLAAGSSELLHENCCWEYIDTPIYDLPENLQAHAAAIGETTERRVAPKLVIVAAPGVAIKNKEYWPSNCYVEIYRVQSKSLVPGWGERIDTSALTAQTVISPFDHFESDASEDPAAMTKTELYWTDRAYWTETRLDHWRGEGGLLTESPSDVPYVTVKPFRKNGRCGVVLMYQTGTGVGWRGAQGDVEVTIDVDETSGTQRFAYDFFHYVDTTSRTVGYEEETWNDIRLERMPQPITDDHFEILRSRFILYRTSGVNVTVKDSGIGIWDSITSLFGYDVEAVFDYRLYLGTFANIPPQGTPLMYDAEANSPLSHDWIESNVAMQAGVVSTGEVSWDETPIDAAQNEVERDWAITLADIGIGFVPVVGDYMDVVELLISIPTGQDKWGRPVTGLDQMFMLGGILLPFVSSTALRAMKGTARAEGKAAASWLSDIADEDVVSSVTYREVE